MCYMCAFKASTKSDLKRHLVFTHEVDGKIETKCDQCDAIVKGEKTLKRHMKSVHTNHIEKCNLCDKDFADLVRHTKRVPYVKKETYKCNLCDKSVVDMSRHKEKAHSRIQSLKNDLKTELQKEMNLLAEPINFLFGLSSSTFSLNCL